VVLGLAAESNIIFDNHIKAAKNYHIIFADPPMTAKTKVMFGGFFCLAAKNPLPQKMIQIFKCRRPSPLSLFHARAPPLLSLHAHA
jgi:hypothetical protein